MNNEELTLAEDHLARHMERLAARAKAAAEEQALRALVGDNEQAMYDKAQDMIFRREAFKRIPFAPPNIEIIDEVHDEVFLATPKHAEELRRHREMIQRDYERIPKIGEEPLYYSPEGARRLARAGGSDPGIKSIPRRRPMMEHPVTGHIAVYPTDEDDIGDFYDQYTKWFGNPGHEEKEEEKPKPADHYRQGHPGNLRGREGDKYTDTLAGSVYIYKGGRWCVTGSMSIDPNHPDRRAASGTEKMKRVIRDSRHDYKPEGDEFVSGDRMMDATKGMF